MRRTAIPGATWVLALAQAVNLTVAVISVAIAAVVGGDIAPNDALATIPYGAQFAAVMLCTYPASALMQRWGRRRVFVMAALVLMGAGGLGYLAVMAGSFPLLVATHFLMGAYIACANFYRFAAVDGVASDVKPRVLSLVVAGGVLAAVVGPVIAARLRSVPGFEDFSLCYAVLVPLGLLTLALLAAWCPRGDGRAAPVGAEVRVQPHRLAWRLPIFAAVFTAASGYLVMNLLMVEASLVMKGICGFQESAAAIQAHVLAMFLPSFFTGALINRFGLRSVLLAGFALLLAAAAVGLMNTRYETVYLGLVLLGLGWNFTYVGGGALLSLSTDESDRFRWQGVNDTSIAVCATIGAFLPAPMFTLLGWKLSNALIVPLCLFGLWLCWQALTVQGRNHAQSAVGTAGTK